MPSGSGRFLVIQPDHYSGGMGPPGHAVYPVIAIDRSSTVRWTNRFTTATALRSFAATCSRDSMLPRHLNRP
jgi:hypothetical protein